MTRAAGPRYPAATACSQGSRTRGATAGHPRSAAQTFAQRMCWPVRRSASAWSCRVKVVRQPSPPQHTARNAWSRISAVWVGVRRSPVQIPSCRSAATASATFGREARVLPSAANCEGAPCRRAAREASAVASRLAGIRRPNTKRNNPRGRASTSDKKVGSRARTRPAASHPVVPAAL